MGISNANFALLLAARHASGSQLKQVVTLGKQSFWPTKAFLSAILAITESSDSAEQIISSVNGDGSLFISRYLHAVHVDEIDASPYEGASIIHDMNHPIPSKYHLQFDFLYDGGSSEHIFDVRQVFANINSLVKPGGCVAVSVPANNQLGHGFYQFSPELYYRYFSQINGYVKIAVFLCEHQLPVPSFWQVKDPAILRKRIEIQNSSQLYLLCIAIKGSHVPEPTIPQQSDYAKAWDEKIDNQVIAPIARPTTRASTKWRDDLQTIPRRLAGKLVIKSIGFAARFRNSSTMENEGPSYKVCKGLLQDGIDEISLEDFISYRFTS